ncbi:YheC/YheD family protein [Sporosarcina luteola]|uniref:YheC/YheD family protein n=1 Tax=Sporosarcina luteola TaxID=582850 RepID=UPI00203BDA50|nr:YheC/YheD family protein [Sporosarcina luteola]MCM3711553.1 YheC/YheD family protein [Sporosarcina luteola]
MKRTLGKWEQNLLLQQDPVVAKHIPETVLYSENNLDDLLNRYESVYVKHDTAGQGRAIFKIQKGSGKFHVNGFTIQGTPIQQLVTRVGEIQHLLHPFIKLGRESGPYIIQEDIKSYTQNGQPFAIRVHVQKLNNEWVIGGMLGNIATGPVTQNGIVNRMRGAELITISELDIQMKTVKKIQAIAIQAAKTIDSAFPCREYGIDFGINQEGTPILIEVNTTPGISGFAQLNIATWKRIVEIRKMQGES